MILTPETKLTFKAMKACDEKSTTKVFLAGSIENGRAKNWQKSLAQNLQNKFGDNVIIFNPRRENWDPDATVDAVREQIDWELNAQEISDLIVFFFDENTTSPITLLELGLAINSNKRILVWCPELYYRYTNVYETLKYHDMEHLLITENFEDAIYQVVMDIKDKPKKIKPLVPSPSIPSPFTWPPYDKTSACTCSVCGLSLQTVMGYVCNRSDCPTFLKVTY
jgi:hypothetical protein